MNTAQFHQAVEQVWQQIEETIDSEGLSVDTEIQGSVCTLTFDDESQIIINKQEAMLELWLASKLGGFHFKNVAGEWVTAEGRSFWQHLTEAFARHGEEITF
ncbi:iron donor protein CyaY [Mannheimia granulomatis]|uniref:iron donor protein CyaY n=1 Tax=Mannheimia granulomatis TaxID=85402 RepID=UPI00159E621F|nr:iron donor protein CyaY [Mannheimia granulomatis]QLB14396.1 iron donor protein CyaY [Mannheimia granulomatis]